jgi:hypothetical protein
MRKKERKKERKKKKKCIVLFFIHWILIVHSVLTYSTVGRHYDSASLFFFLLHRIINNVSHLKKYILLARIKNPHSHSVSTDVCSRSIYPSLKKMSNLYSVESELCYLPMLIVFIVFLSFPFNVVLYLTYNRCMHTYTCSKTASMMRIMYG